MKNLFLYLKNKILFPNIDCLILTYHGIDDESSSSWSLSLKKFRDDINEIIDSGCIFVNSSKVNSLNSENKYCALQFDDGLISSSLAIDVLISKGIPCTIFPSTKPMVEKRKTHFSFEILREYAENKLIEIGSHGHEHIDFTKFDESFNYEDFLKSSDILKEELGINSSLYAFPHNRFNEKMVMKLLGGGVDSVFLGRYVPEVFKNENRVFKRIMRKNENILRDLLNE